MLGGTQVYFDHERLDREFGGPCFLKAEALSGKSSRSWLSVKKEYLKVNFFINITSLVLFYGVQ